MGRLPQTAIIGSPRGTGPLEPIPIIPPLPVGAGRDHRGSALAIGWTQNKVEVQWKIDWLTRSEWVPASDVRRRGACDCQ